MQKRTPTKLWILALVGFLSLSMASCDTVAETNRSRLLFTSIEQENALGLEAYQQMMGEAKLIKSGPNYEMVVRAGRKIAKAADDKAAREGRAPYGFDWEFNLVDDPNTINAFCLPGGKVAVYTGILPVATGDGAGEDGLAAIMGHEVAHATARHGGERMSQNVLAQGTLTAAALGLSLAGLEESTQEGVMTAINAGAQYGVLLPYSREHESEADLIGLMYLIDAGYDPYEAPKLWERMAKLSPERPPEFQSTHPDPTNRAEALRKMIPELMQKAGRLKQIQR